MRRSCAYHQLLEVGTVVIVQRPVAFSQVAAGNASTSGFTTEVVSSRPNQGNDVDPKGNAYELPSPTLIRGLVSACDVGRLRASVWTKFPIMAAAT
eukprot:1188013-Prorocentrum_minimum.AAC.2